jgi:hypothetical protein
MRRSLWEDWRAGISFLDVCSQVQIGHCEGVSFMSAHDPKQTLATRPKARLSLPVRPMLVATNTTRKADHVKKRDPRGGNKNRNRI